MLSRFRPMSEKHASGRPLSVKEIKKLEKAAWAIGLRERILIENASAGLTGALNSLELGPKALVIAGRGNNGADVLSCARKLAGTSRDVRVIILNDKLLGKRPPFRKISC